jgi:uncharacterized protein YaiE (UPF0345 family)
MINVNEYFDGKIKSLGFELDSIQYTAGVFSPSAYSLGTEKEEHVTVTVGGFEIRLPDSDWTTVKAGETIIIPPNTTFDLKVTKTASYLCMYK